jgi:hypothetical protein
MTPGAGCSSQRAAPAGVGVAPLRTNRTRRVQHPVLIGHAVLAEALHFSAHRYTARDLHAARHAEEVRAPPRSRFTNVLALRRQREGKWLKGFCGGEGRGVSD